MRKLSTDMLGGIAMLGVTVGVASPALFGLAKLSIPRGWWVVTFVAFLGVLIFSTSGSRKSILKYSMFALAVVLSWMLVTTAPGMGLLLILLVVTAAVSVYVVPVWMGLIVATLNSALIAFVTWQRLADSWETLILTGFYFLIQVATLFSTTTLLREQRLRRELTRANIELQTAQVLLTESAKTAERLRISRELHDVLGHQLTVLTLATENARHTVGDAQASHIDNADRTARQLLSDVRATVGQLRMTTPDLEAALHALGEAVPELTFIVEIEEGLTLDEEHNAVVLRAAQEIFTNTLRHAYADELQFRLTREGDWVVLRTRDNGVGARTVVRGNGLTGIAERFTLLGGDISVDGSDGFVVEGRMPTV